MGLREDLVAWDLKSARDVGAIFDRHASHPSFLREVVGLLNEVPLQRGATWLLKHHFDGGGKPIGAHLEGEVYDRLSEFPHWESKLHVLQCMSHMPISESLSQTVERGLRESLGSSNKFLRAWAYSGYYFLATQHPRYRAEATKMLEAALKDEAPSVKARVRKVYGKEW